MFGLDYIGLELTSCHRVEEVQGEETINRAACIKGKICMEYCITVETPAFGKWHGTAPSLRWLAEMQKVILQIQPEECKAFIHLITSCSISKCFSNDIGQSFEE
jgi:hypothetical protein